MVIKMIILCIFILFDVLSKTSGRNVKGGKDADVLIVGGGISGLAAAGRLEKAGLKVIAESKLENALHEYPRAQHCLIYMGTRIDISSVCSYQVSGGPSMFYATKLDGLNLYVNIRTRT